MVKVQSKSVQYDQTIDKGKLTHPIKDPRWGRVIFKQICLCLAVTINCCRSGFVPAMSNCGKKSKQHATILETSCRR
jgi:hypothetical protein